MTYYLRFGNEVLASIDADGGAISITTSQIDSKTSYIQVLAFTTRADAEDLKKEYYTGLRNFTVSNNLQHE